MQSLPAVCVPVVSWKALCPGLAGTWGDPKHSSRPGGTLLCKRYGCAGEERGRWSREARLVPEMLIYPYKTPGSVAGTAWGRSWCPGSHAGLLQGWCRGKAGWQGNATVPLCPHEGMQTLLWAISPPTSLAFPLRPPPGKKAPGSHCGG